VVRQPTAEQLRLCLLAAEKVRLGRDGSVTILGNRYWSATLASQPTGVDYVVRFNPEDATDPVSVSRGSQFICEADLIARTGFRDQEAAKDDARHKRRFIRAKNVQADAILGRSKAKAWIAPDGSDMDAQLEAAVARNILPFPKVIEPVRPGTNYSPPDTASDGITDAEFLDAILAPHAPKRSGER
jgi:hypothetical protein